MGTYSERSSAKDTFCFIQLTSQKALMHAYAVFAPSFLLLIARNQRLWDLASCARIWIGPLRSSTSLLYLATEPSPKLSGDGDASTLSHLLIGPGGATFLTSKSKVCAQPATADKKKSFPDREKPFPDIAFFELSLCNKRHASGSCVPS